MAKMPASTTITCPACGTDIAIPITSGRRSTTVAFDTSGVRTHIAEHLAADEHEPALGFIVSDQARWPELRDNSVRFEQVRAWLLANGIEPRDVPAKSTVAIEPRPDGSEVIRYTAYLRSENGQYLVPPGHASPATAQRLAPMLVPLPCRTTDGDE